MFKDIEDIANCFIFGIFDLMCKPIVSRLECGAVTVRKHKDIEDVEDIAISLNGAVKCHVRRELAKGQIQALWQIQAL